ncbi:nuclear transport factor 2 family protein [Granulicella arctica]|uniref:nuclear transport factor 2 family protein n=1 Tax=Granulicella arctica TaxID=940613 RepID=UPI0037BEA3F5
MTPASVLRTHQEVFYQSLLHQDWDALASLYADDYNLVRSNGTSLSKEEVLNDLQVGALVFRSIRLMNERVRVVGSVAMLTGESQTITERRGVVFESHFRLIAVYVEAEGSARLLYFQSTDIPKTPQILV